MSITKTVSQYSFLKTEEEKAQLEHDELMDYDNGYDHFNLSRMSRRQNWHWLKNYGHDKLTYHPELHEKGDAVFRKFEPWMAWGQPYTYILQGILIYGIGLYTAKKQGIIAGHNYMCRFWRNHWFDWITFFKNSFIQICGAKRIA